MYVDKTTGTKTLNVMHEITEREIKNLSKYRMKTAKYERLNCFYMRSWPIFGHYSRADSGTAHLIVLAIHTATFDPKGQTK